MLDTPNHSGRTTRRDVGEKVRVLEHGLRRGGVEDHFFGREECVVSGHKGVVSGIHRGLSGGIVNLISRSRLNFNCGKRLMGAVSDGVAGIPALVACTCPLAGHANLFLGVGH